MRVSREISLGSSLHKASTDALIFSWTVFTDLHSDSSDLDIFFNT